MRGTTMNKRKNLREKVIKGLTYCAGYENSCPDCPYNTPFSMECTTSLSRDALSLLEETTIDITGFSPEAVRLIRAVCEVEEQMQEGHDE